MERLNINELNIKELEQIPIPEGLEERLSAKIDEWDAASRHKLPSLEGGAGGRLERGLLRVPQVVVVVVDALDEQEACAGLLVECCQPLGVQLVGLPVAQHLLVAHL